MTEAIQTINLSDYTQTGEGGTAITYTKKDEQSLAKLYKNGFEADTPRCVHGDLHIGNIITDGERHLWIDVGEFAYGAPEWDLALLWTMCHNMPDDRVQHIFHITHDQMQAHWDIFFPAYLGTSDPQAIAEATQRLMPYYAAKVPYIFDMVFSKPMSDVALQNIIKRF